VAFNLRTQLQATILASVAGDMKTLLVYCGICFILAVILQPGHVSAIEDFFCWGKRATHRAKNFATSGCCYEPNEVIKIKAPDDNYCKVNDELDKKHKAVKCCKTYGLTYKEV